MRWALSNAWNRLQFAVKNPSYALRAVLREISLADEKFLSVISRVPPREIRAFLDEPAATPPFAARLLEVEAEMRKLRVQSADLYAKKVLLQYIAVRALRPKTIVETGVANGVSTSYLLLALEKNGVGMLHSIEIGDRAYLPEGKEPGWIVPDWLKPRWDLLIGDSRELLPKVLSDLGPIDLFIHDSLHTYDQMLWEYRCAVPHLIPGGVLISDDAGWNSAFSEFATEIHAQHSAILRGVGFLQKNTV